MYEVKLTSRALQEFNMLSLSEQDRILKVLNRLSVDPRTSGVRKICGNIYRVRTGNWRVIYAVFDKDRLVLVGRIVRRSEDTYDRVKDLF